jgi:branched-chain amino acid transport system permease protein
VGSDERLVTPAAAARGLLPATGSFPGMTLVWGGLAVGGVYALVALGYNIVFTASGTFNFAHAQLLVVGTFVAYWGLGVAKLPVVVVFLLCGAVVAVLAAVEERIAIRPVRGTEGHLVTTVGVATLLSGASELIWGGGALAVPFLDSTGVWTVFGGRVRPVSLLLLGCAVVVTAGAVLYARTSMIGIATLAMAEDREAAALRGVNVRMVSLGAFAVSGALAGLVAPVVGPQTFAVATLGSALALKGFVALAIAGFGSLGGGLLGGLAVGLIESYTARYLGSAYVNMVIFGVLMVILLSRPNGLFGRTRERMV